MSSLVKCFDHEGNEKILCQKCKTFKYRTSFTKDDNFRVQICSDCYAEDYKEEIESLMELAKVYDKILEYGNEYIIELVGQDEFDKIMELVNKFLL